MTEKIKDSNKGIPDYSKNDIVLDYFIELFDGVIGKPYTAVELSIIYEEGEKRYEEKVPPGYKDLDKKGLVKRYGDTVIKSEYGGLLIMEANYGEIKRK